MTMAWTHLSDDIDTVEAYEKHCLEFSLSSMTQVWCGMLEIDREDGVEHQSFREELFLDDLTIAELLASVEKAWGISVAVELHQLDSMKQLSDASIDAIGYRQKLREHAGPLLRIQQRKRLARRQRIASASPEGHFSVLSYNINTSLARSPKSSVVLQCIKEADADIVLLQEVSPAWEQLLLARLGHYPHHRVVASGQHAGGSAVFSRFPIESSAPLEPTVDGSVFPCALHAIRAPAGELLLVANVHLRPPIMLGTGCREGPFAMLHTAGIRRREIQRVLRRLLMLRGDQPSQERLLVAGDFNENDGHAAHAWLCLEERFEDALFLTDQVTHWWHYKSFLVEKRLDHICARGLVPTHCRVMDAALHAASDHHPVLARFVFE